MTFGVILFALWACRVCMSCSTKYFTECCQRKPCIGFENECKSLEDSFSKNIHNVKFTQREKSPNWDYFWFVFSHIWTAYEEILRISPHLVRMRENTDQKNSEYGHFSRSVRHNLFPLLDLSSLHITLHDCFA